MFSNIQSLLLKNYVKRIFWNIVIQLRNSLKRPKTYNWEITIFFTILMIINPIHVWLTSFRTKNNFWTKWLHSGLVCPVRNCVLETYSNNFFTLINNKTILWYGFNSAWFYKKNIGIVIPKKSTRWGSSHRPVCMGAKQLRITVYFVMNLGAK